MTICEVYDRFIMSRVLRDLSPKTVLNYKELIRPFLDFIGLDTDIDDICQSDIEDYIYFVLNRSIARATKTTYIRHFKTFLKWISEEYIVNYKYEKIKVPKCYKKVRKIYDALEVKKIFDSIVAESDWLTLRNKCMISLMYDSGLRRSELLTVRFSRLSFSERIMTICGKGDKERTVPIGAFSVSLLKEYKKLCPYESDIVFLGRYGKPITDNAIKLLVHKISQKVPFEFSCHKLRHNFATNYCIDQYDKYGHIDIYKLMYLMGHEDLETTRVYLHFANSIIASKENISHLDKLALSL